MDNEEEKEKEEVKGFAGLSSMASDVDAVVDSPPKRTQKVSSGSAPKPAADNRPQDKEEQPEADPWTGQRTTQPSGGSSAGKWLVGIAVVIGLIWLANQSDSNRPSRPAHSSGTSSASVAPASQPAVVQPQVPSRPAESKPSVGRNNVLSTAQIRYCLAEKIRLDASETILNNYSDSDVDRFNGYVNDYNSRCGEYRYRQGALERARRDVEPYRGQLQADGRGRFVRSPSVGTVAPSSAQAPKAVRPTPDVTVQAIQGRLNALGYNAGPADGLFGGKTRAAIRAFQRDNGISADGVANAFLLRKLEVSEQTKRQEASSPLATQSALSSSARPSAASQSISDASEKAAIDRACDSTRQYASPSAYQNCLNRELANLQSSGGRPDLSLATPSERSAIEAACDSARQYSGPGAYYNCLNREISSLRSSRGRPDLSVATDPERNAIERSCDSARQYSGPGAYYKCLNRELSSLRSTGGMPDLSIASGHEQAAIERACDSARQYSGPGTYYGCLNREVASLRLSGGRPSFSSMPTSMEAAIERTCNSSRQYSGPGAYYKCLRRELNKAGYR